MADLQQVQINEPVEETNKTLEQQAAEQDAVANPTTDENRPEWLPEKFNSPEELAKSYNELQSKLSQPEDEESTEEQPTETEGGNINSAISSATTEFEETGELTDASYKALAEAGIPKEFVDAYMAGQTAVADTESVQIMDSVGGQEQYQAMSEWALENLSDDELDTYNEMVESGSSQQAQMAVAGLHARYTAGGGGVQLTQGSTSGVGIKPFNSAAQVTEAMRDKRYSTDPAYRKEVEQRLSVSNAF